MNSERTILTLGPTVIKYLKENRGSEEYINDMVEISLNLLSEQGSFDFIAFPITIVEWTESDLVVEPQHFKDLGAAGSVTIRSQLYSLLALMEPKLIRRFVRYVEEDLLERAFNGPARQNKTED